MRVATAQHLPSVLVVLMVVVVSSSGYPTHGYGVIHCCCCCVRISCRSSARPPDISYTYFAYVCVCASGIRICCSDIGQNGFYYYDMYMYYIIRICVVVVRGMCALDRVPGKPWVREMDGI